MYFLLLVFRVSLNLGLDVSYKRGGFSKTLLEKSLEFIPSEKSGLVALNLGLMLLLAKINPVSEERSRKENTLGSRSTGRVEIVLALLTEIIALYMQVSIIQVGITGLEGSLPGAEFAWACSWPLTNNSRANLVAFCRSTLVYIPGGPEAGLGA